MSIEKFSDFLSKRGYSVLMVYVCEGSIRFVEARTPKYQKNFMIHVASKYKMVPSRAYKTVNITYSQGEFTRQTKYMDELKGTFVECDITAVSSKYVCIYKNNGTSEVYIIKNGAIDSPSHTETQETPTQKIITDASRVFKNLNKTLSVPEPKHKISAPPPEEDNVTFVDDDGETEDVSENIELVFEDEEGESVSDVTDFIESEQQTPNISTVQKETYDESVVDLEDEDIILGVIYYTTDMASCYNMINTLEEKISVSYDIIEDNENTMRDDRVSEIEELIQGVVIKVKAQHETYVTQELELKEQLSKLSSIFDQTTGLKDKIKTDAKYSDAKGDIDNIYIQTRNTIRDLNLELLRLRDSFDEFLDNTKATLAEIMK